MEEVELAPIPATPALAHEVGLLRRLTGNRFVRQGSEMVFWRIMALGFGAAGSIWAARCLGPENLGISGMIIATVAQAVLLVDLNQNVLFVRKFKACESDEERTLLVSTVFTFRWLFCLVIVAVGIPLAVLIQIPTEWRVGIAAAFPLLLLSCNQPIWVLQAQENLPASFKAIAIPPIITASIYFSFFRPGVSSGFDVIVQAMGQGLAFGLGWHFALKRHAGRILRWDLLSRVWPLIKEGKWLIVTGLVSYIYLTLESPLLGYFRPIDEVGQYRTATKMIGVATSFLAMIPMLLYPRLLEWKKEGHQILWQRQKKIAIIALCVLIPSSGAAFALAPLMYRLIYGPQFEAAALPFAILLTSHFIGVVNSVFALGLWAQGEDRRLTALMTGVAVVSLGCNLLLVPEYGMLAAAAVHSGSEVLILIGVVVLAQAPRNSPRSRATSD